MWICLHDFSLLMFFSLFLWFFLHDHVCVVSIMSVRRLLCWASTSPHWAHCGQVELSDSPSSQSSLHLNKSLRDGGWISCRYHPPAHSISCQTGNERAVSGQEELRLLSSCSDEEALWADSRWYLSSVSSACSAKCLPSKEEEEEEEEDSSITHMKAA